MGWCFRSQANGYTDEVLDAMGDSKAVVPSIWSYEVANALLTAERKGTQTRAESIHFLNLLNDLPISVVPENLKEWKDLLLWMGKTYGLSGYDTAYLYLAMDQGLPLASRDRKMMAAAKSAGVAIYQP